jgi:hypothetical protein
MGCFPTEGSRPNSEADDNVAATHFQSVVSCRKRPPTKIGPEEALMLPLLVWPVGGLELIEIATPAFAETPTLGKRFGL